MLQIKDLKKIFNRGTVNEKVALTGVNFTLNPGDFVPVIGGNGAGKSTLLNCVAGVYPVDEGHIFLDGHEVTKLPEHRRAKHLGRVFQDPMMGTGSIVIGLASLIIGEVLFGGRGFYRRLLALILGAVTYRVIIALVLKMGMNSNDLKLFTAVTVALCLWLPQGKEMLAKFKKSLKKEGA